MPTFLDFSCVATEGGKTPSSLAFRVTGENKRSSRTKDKLEKESKYTQNVSHFS